MIRSTWIAELFDEWFDYRNTTKNYKYNENIKPFFSHSDERVKWLEETLLVELVQWKASVSGSTFLKEKSNYFLIKLTVVLL